MRLSESGMRKWFRVSSAFTILGLVIEIVSLCWIHPLAFALFAFLGASLIGLGILIYLTSLVFTVSTGSSRPSLDN